MYDEGVRGASQPREVIIRLLELDPSSAEVAYLKERAAELAHIATGNSASISGAIGVDLCSCDMNCKFCAFGTEWGLVEEDVIELETAGLLGFRGCYVSRLESHALCQLRQHLDNKPAQE